MGRRRANKELINEWFGRIERKLESIDDGIRRLEKHPEQFHEIKWLVRMKIVQCLEQILTLNAMCGFRPYYTPLMKPKTITCPKCGSIKLKGNKPKDMINFKITCKNCGYVF